MAKKSKVVSKVVEIAPEEPEDSEEELEYYSGSEELLDDEDGEDEQELDEEEDDDNDGAEDGDYGEEDGDDEENSGVEDDEMGEDDEEEVDTEEEELVIQEDKVDDLTYDIHNLVACNYHTMRVEGESMEDTVRKETERVTQLLFKKLMNCPVEQSPMGPLVVLPSEAFRMPRCYKLPEEQPETKWEKFAKEKGIKNKKRERMVYDELTDSFRPRYGYQSKKNALLAETPVMEVKTGADPFADPWAEERVAKKQRVKKNEKNQKKNLFRAGKGKKGMPTEYDSVAVPGIPIELSTMSKNKRGKAGIKKALQLAQLSTASMGRFDDMRKGEPERKLKGKRQSFRDNLKMDKDIMHSQLRIVADKVDKKAKGVTNSLAPYAGIIPDAPTNSFKRTKGSNKVRNSETSSKKRRK